MRPGRCAACKYLRRKCPPDCFLSPYSSNDPQRLACVHRIYGASNVKKMLQLEQQTLCILRHNKGLRALSTAALGLSITQLNQQINDAETELAKARAEIALMSSSTATNFGGQEEPLHHPHRHDHYYDHHNYDHDYHDYQVLEMESDLNNLLQGQSGIDQQSHLIGPTTKAPRPWLVGWSRNNN